MSAPQPHPRRRRGAHRTGRSVAEAILPSFLAVLAVAALITSVAVWRGEQPGPPSAAVATTSAGAGEREALSRAPSTPPATAAASSSAASTASAAPTTSAPAGGGTPEQAGPADFAVQVVVLNQTSRAGLAGEVATRLRGQGWNVPAVGNFRGVVPATTVYYPAGQEAAAQAAAESLPSAPRIRPRFGNLSTTRLTVVVTDTYPG